MKTKLNKLITKLTEENEEVRKKLNKGLSKYKTSRAKQTLQMNLDFIEQLQKTLL